MCRSLRENAYGAMILNSAHIIRRCQGVAKAALRVVEMVVRVRGTVTGMVSFGKVRRHLKLQDAYELPERGFYPVEKLFFPFTSPVVKSHTLRISHESDPEKALLNFRQTVTDLH